VMPPFCKRVKTSSILVGGSTVSRPPYGFTETGSVGTGWSLPATQSSLQRVRAKCGHSQGEGPVFQTVLTGFDFRCPLEVFAGDQKVWRFLAKEDVWGSTSPRPLYVAN